MNVIEKKVNNKTFKLVVNSIIDEKVDAIVNPANRNLAHGGGVAGLISEAGGPEIQKESDKKAPMETGTATYTTAGRLAFKYVIHAVGPIYQGGDKGEAERLKSAVSAALSVAHQLQLESVSMPAVSTGIFGYPLEPAIVIIYKAILEFMETGSTLKEIRLCEYSTQKAEEIKRIIEGIS